MKVNFNGGDSWFYRGNDAVSFKGHAWHWPAWLDAVLQREQIDAIVLFGQMRPLHATAISVAKLRNVQVYVFEEGYFRPDYVTLECGGVNAYSKLPRDEAVYRRLQNAPLFMPKPTGQGFRKMAWLATQYAVAAWFGKPWFPYHQYHRPIHPVLESLRWFRGGWRKQVHAWRQRGVLEQLCALERSRRWYLMPLQVESDSQIVHHSDFSGMRQVIEEVMASFAAHAPADQWLVIKHHPMDRAYHDHTKYIRDLTAQYGLQDRVLYVHDLHLPTLLKHCRGVVTVNSTTGLQALHHNAPVYALGDCFYGIPGLVNAGTLEQFWQEPMPVDHQFYCQFHHYAVLMTQLNASFYAGAPALDSHPSTAVTGPNPLRK